MKGKDVGGVGVVDGNSRRIVIQCRMKGKDIERFRHGLG